MMSFKPQGSFERKLPAPVLLRRSARHYLAVVLLLLCGISGYGQSTASVTRLSVRDGLSNDVTNPLLIDRGGNLWIGYYSGVQRYNGLQLITFDGRNGLEETQIANFAQDTSGIVYVLTVGGMYRYTGGNAPQSFRRCEDEGVGSAVVLDSLHYYIGYGFRPDLYYRAGSRRTRIYMGGDTLSGMAGDAAGNVYASAGNTIYYVRDGIVQGRISMPLRNLLIWYDGTAMYAHAAGDTLVYRLDGARASILYHQPTLAQLPAIAYRVLLQSTGATYTMTGSGQILRLYAGGRADTVVAIPVQGRRFSDMQPVADGFWASSEYGLYHIVTRPGFDTAAFTPLFRPNGFGGVMAAPLDAGLLPAAAAQKMQALQAGKNFRQYYRDGGGGTWTLGYTELLYTDPRGRAIPFGSAALPQPPADGEIRDLIEDRQGRAWLLTENNVVEWRKGQPMPYTIDSIPGGRPAHLFLGTTDAANTLFLATSQGLFAGSGGHYHDLMPELGLQRNSIFDLNPTPDGRVWVNVSVSKLYCIGKANGRYRITDSVAASWGSYSPSPQDISCDAAGNLWVNYVQELVVYLRLKDGHYSSDSIVTFTGADGLDALGSSGMHLYPMADGNMLLKGKHLLLYSPAMVAARRIQPPPAVSLEGLQLYGRPTDWAAAGYLTDATGLPQGLRLGHLANYLTFYYSAADLSNGKYITYRYKLEGLDGDWQPATTDIKATYNSLRPGKYQFLVQAADANRHWSRPYKFAFTILPPWWATWWAYTIYALLLAAGIYAFITLRIRTVRRKAAVAQKITEAEKAVLEQQLKALRAQINPHFLQNTFDFLSQTLDEQPVKRSQQVIRQLSSYLRNVLYRTDENVVTLEDELAFAEEYLAINRLLFHNRFAYAVALADDVDTFGLRLPSMLLQPILENAIKHGTGAGAPGEILLRVYRQDGETVCCEISNTLTDARRAAQPAGYRPKGLDITMQRLALLYGKQAQAATASAGEKDGRYVVRICLPL